MLGGHHKRGARSISRTTARAETRNCSADEESTSIEPCEPEAQKAQTTYVRRSVQDAKRRNENRHARKHARNEEAGTEYTGDSPHKG